MKKALIVSYAFPPNAAVGTYRILKFCKYLPEFGWEPVVLTIENPRNTLIDKSLLDELHEGLRVYRAPKWSFSRPNGNGQTPLHASNGHRPGLWKKAIGKLTETVSIPDRHFNWILPAVTKGLEISKREGFDVIFSSSPPNSGHVAAYLLSRLTGKPFVVDLRDLWMLNESHELRAWPVWRRWLESSLERQILLRSRGVITASPGFTSRIRTSYPKKPTELFHTITNGLDPADFSHLAESRSKNDKFTILHLGSLYGLRRPEPFFATLTRWVQETPSIKNRIRVRFLGHVPPELIEITDPTLRSIVSFEEPVPHREALLSLWEADLLLLLLGYTDSSTGVIPAKLFDYIASRRPILAYVPDGEAARLVERYRAGFVVRDPASNDGLKYLARAYERWLKGNGHERKAAFIPPELHRRNLTLQLASVLDGVANGN